MVMHLTISFDTLINTLIHNQSSRKSSVLTGKISLGPLFGHRAGVAVFLALNLLNIESAMRPLLDFVFTGIQLIIYNESEY
jgi:hypothetical protein